MNCKGTKGLKTGALHSLETFDICSLVFLEISFPTKLCVCVSSCACFYAFLCKERVKHAPHRNRGNASGPINEPIKVLSSIEGSRSTLPLAPPELMKSQRDLKRSSLIERPKVARAKEAKELDDGSCNKVTLHTM